MHSVVEYPIQVNAVLVHRFGERRIPASIALLAMLLFAFFLVGNAPAQTVSPSPGAHINVAPPTGSVDRVPTGPVAPPIGPVAPPTGGFGFSSPGAVGLPHSPTGIHGGNRHHHHQQNPAIVAYPYFYPVPVPYTDGANDDATDQNGDAESQVPDPLDWQQNSQNAYRAPPYWGPMRPPDGNSQRPSTSDLTASDSANDSPPTPTVLVFKDGHQLEVENYAIVGPTIYDLSSGHTRKIAITDLDLAATEKENDNRGVVFQLPTARPGS
jgi:hypothetical protein